MLTRQPLVSVFLQLVFALGKGEGRQGHKLVERVGAAAQPLTIETVTSVAVMARSAKGKT